MLDDSLSAPPSRYSPLTIYVFLETEALGAAVEKVLAGDRYSLTQLPCSTDLLDRIEQHKEEIDCFVLEACPSCRSLLASLSARGTLLPIVLLITTDDPNNSTFEAYTYHEGEVWHAANSLAKIPAAINQAIAQFLQLAPTCSLDSTPTQAAEKESTPNFLLLQQHRLSEKLKERLGYLGVYYKRNSQDFFRNLSRRERERLRDVLSAEYREIVLDYFSKNDHINQIIDRFVNQAFFADLSVSQILEIHMELMDDFAQQLKLEGRSEEILLDYRLVLIDIIAHLCEMYRRSIPRKDLTDFNP